jgi:hypothetical protein
MPTVNIPPRIRFALYIAGALASLFVSYAVNKTWAGDAEVQLVSGVVALINVLAAAKTDLSSPPLEDIANHAAREELAHGRHEREPVDRVRDLLDRKGL